MDPTFFGHKIFSNPKFFKQKIFILVEKPNLPNQTYQTKPTKPNLPNQTYQTKPTKPNVSNQNYQMQSSKTDKFKVALSLFLLLLCWWLYRGSVIVIMCCHDIWSVNTIYLANQTKHIKIINIKTMFPNYSYNYVI